MARKQENILESYADYLRIIREQSEATIKNYKASVNSLFKFIHGEDFNIDNITLTQINKVNEDYLVKYKISLVKVMKTGSTIRARFEAIQSFYKFIRYQYKVDNSRFIFEIAELKKDIKTDPESKNVLTRYECIKLLDSIKNDYDNKYRERDLLAVALFLSNGLRLSELLTLKEEDFKIESKTLNLKRKNTKGKKGRELPLQDAIINLYNEYIGWKRDSKHSDNDYVFVSNLSKSEHLSSKQMQVIVNKYTRALGLKDISPHCFRATFATLLNESGASPFEIKEQMGHANIQTTGIYIVIDGKRMRQVNNMVKLYE